MTKDVHDEVSTFIERLRAFHDTLPVAQQEMMDAILDAARQDDDTTGHHMMPNPYLNAELNRQHMSARMREGEQARMADVAMAAARADEAPPAPARTVRRFDWLHAWLTAALGDRQVAR